MPRAVARTGHYLTRAAAACAVAMLMAFPAVAASGICRGVAPAEGAALRGPVLHVPDGRTLCVARGFDPSLWIPLELADAPTPTTRATLMAVAFGKDVDCILKPGGVAECSLEGRSVGELAAEPEMIDAGRGWRESSVEAKDAH